MLNMRTGNDIETTMGRWLALFVLLILVSCSPNKNRPEQNSNSKPETIDQRAQEMEQQAQEYLKPLLRVGESPTNLVEQFGPSAREDEISSNEYCLTFFFSGRNRTAENAGVGGFDAFFVSNRLSRWLPIYKDSVYGGSAVGTSPIILGEQTFSVFIQGDSLTSLLNTFDLEGSADASDLKSSPNIVFKARVSLGNNESLTSTNNIMTLVIGNQYVPKLKTFTEDNIGKRVMIVCHGKIIAAPFISEPLSSDQVMITVKDSRVLDILQSK
jgi:hypothetical protein